MTTPPSNEMNLLIEAAAERAAQRAVHQTLVTLGIDAGSPIERQKDFAALAEIRIIMEDPETQRDFMHLRRWRKGFDSVQSKGVLVFFGLVTLGLVTAAYLGFKTRFGLGGP